MKFIALVVGLLFTSRLCADPILFVTEDLPPYQLVNDKNQLIGGTFYALVKYVAEQAQIDAQFRVMPWARAYQTALTTPNTFIFSMVRNPNREDKFIWIGKLRQLKYHFYSITHDSESIHNLSDLKAGKIAVVRGSIEEILLKNLGFEDGVNLITVTDYASAQKMVYLKRANAMYANEYLIRGLGTSYKNTDLSFKVVFSVNQVLELYVAANKHSDKQLVERFQQSFVNAVQSGKAKQIIAIQEAKIFTN